jgi:UDPglucose 6-dehydrogenase
MRVAVVGTGYVGLVTGAGLADAGLEVTCIDIDAARIARLNAGEIPFYEPGLEELVSRTSSAHRLTFSTDLRAGIAGRSVVLSCVGTPSLPSGAADLSAVEAVARAVAEHATGAVVLATKSTVPVGTSKRLRELVSGAPHPISIASNPEFLKEGDAVNDFLKPERIIIGADDEAARSVLEALYRPLLLREPRLYVMSTTSAELTKYAANGMLATRISFMNELSSLCEVVGASIDDVRRGIASDSRIGKAFLYAGVGYGGSCFPKDVKALVHTGRAHGVPMSILEATDTVNLRQRGVMLEKVISHFGGSVAGKVVALWGLAFKPRTDDIREAPAIPLIEGLLAQGAVVKAWDRAAIRNAKARFGDKVVFGEDEYAVCDGADALVVMTEWPEFRMPDWNDVERRLKAKVVFDGRNIYDASMLRGRGFRYYGIGRPHPGVG